ncbi:hypothetical protein GWK91_16220 [Virgibacillus sp. MSP4-1]|uniref:hypothetical protein n=1 Tax=Virgibacillus sp. MSP4-1 TaxID=2700081 RepID=UPI00039AB857|nr:hypothetical protein [Virgibacillus sp. MSP4-1]QHS24328.1 hypothetical protein GWK91_16220 [Virgibacillus sp. MSP4-1]
MSIKGSRKEFILNLILKQNPSLISQFIGGEYRHLESERYENTNENKMYIDMYGYQYVNNLTVYVETQLTKADQRHFEKVKNIIEAIEEGIIIWIATDFKEEYTQQLYNLLHFSIAKPINLYMVLLSNSCLFQLDVLNKQGQIEVWGSIKNQKVDLPILSLFKAIEIVPSDFQSKLKEDISEPLTTIKGVNRYFIRCLKERVPYFLNAHRSKANLNKRQIVFGAGVGGLDYVVCLKDINERCYFKQRLSYERHQEIYNKILQVIKKEVRYNLLAIEQNEVIFSYPENFDMLKRITSIIDHFEQLILLVDPIVNEQNGINIVS